MKDTEGEPISPADFFSLPGAGEDEPRAIADRLVADLPEFHELRSGQPVIMFLLRAGPKLRNGKAVLGEMALPRFQGGTAPLALWLLAKVCGGTLPDYLCALDAGWWAAATLERRTALVHHELKHCGIARDREGDLKFDDDGNPQWAIVAHDLEEFQDTVRRYGDWAGDVRPFLEAAIEGGVQP